MPQIEMPYVLSLLHHHQKFDAALGKKRPHRFLKPLECASYVIAEAEVIKGDIAFYAPNGDKRLLSDITHIPTRQAIVLAIYKALQTLKPANC